MNTTEAYISFAKRGGWRGAICGFPQRKEQAGAFVDCARAHSRDIGRRSWRVRSPIGAIRGKVGKIYRFSGMSFAGEEAVVASQKRGAAERACLMEGR